MKRKENLFNGVSQSVVSSSKKTFLSDIFFWWDLFTKKWIQTEYRLNTDWLTAGRETKRSEWKRQKTRQQTIGVLHFRQETHIDNEQHNNEREGDIHRIHLRQKWDRYTSLTDVCCVVQSSSPIMRSEESEGGVLLELSLRFLPASSSDRISTWDDTTQPPPILFFFENRHNKTTTQEIHLRLLDTIPSTFPFVAGLARESEGMTWGESREKGTTHERL